MAFKAKAIQ